MNRIVYSIIGLLISLNCFANPVTVTLSQGCDLDMRLWQVGTSHLNVTVNSDKKTFTVNFPVGTKICAYIDQSTYCSCWGYKYCEGQQPTVCPTGSESKDLLVMIIGGCAVIQKNSNSLVLPINCGLFN